jgi:hypothetical protein
VKKNLILAVLCIFSFTFIFGACSSGNDGNKGISFYQNKLSGKRIEFAPSGNGDNFSGKDMSIIYFVQGETFPLRNFLWEQDIDDPLSYFLNDTAPELANSLWNIAGDIGYFETEGNKTASGMIINFTAGAAGKSGSISVELNGLKCLYPVEIVESKSKLPLFI